MTVELMFSIHELLNAVDMAAYETDDGWVTATEIRANLDGRDGRGKWARALWDLKHEGLLETSGSAAQTLWGLTDLGAEKLLALDKTA